MQSTIESFGAVLAELEVPRNRFDVAIVIDSLRSERGISEDSARRDMLIEIAEGTIRHLSHDGQSAIIYALESMRISRYIHIDEVAPIFCGEEGVYTNPTSPERLIEAMAEGYIGDPNSDRPTIVLYFADGAGWIMQGKGNVDHFILAGLQPYFLLAVTHGNHHPRHDQVHALELPLHYQPLSGAKSVDLCSSQAGLTSRTIALLFGALPEWLSKLECPSEEEFGRGDDTYSWSELASLAYEVADSWVNSADARVSIHSEKVRRQIGGWLTRLL